MQKNVMMYQLQKNDIAIKRYKRYSQGNTNLKIKVTYNIQDLIFESIHSL